MNKLNLGARGFFVRDGQHGEITEVLNGGLFGVFASDTGARFTIEAHEFERDIAHIAPTSHPEERPGHEDGLAATAEAQRVRFSNIAKRTHIEATKRVAPEPCRTVARMEPPTRRLA